MRERTAEDSQEAFGSAGPPACEARRTQGSTRASSKPGANTTGQIINAVSRRKASNMIKWINIINCILSKCLNEMLNAMKSISTHSILTQPAQNISHSFYCCFIVVKPKGLKVIQVPIFYIYIIIYTRWVPCSSYFSFGCSLILKHLHKTICKRSKQFNGNYNRYYGSMLGSMLVSSVGSTKGWRRRDWPEGTSRRQN